MPRTELNADWLDLEKTFPGNSALKSTVVYALPKRLIRAIKKLKLLSTDEINFENELRSRGLSGFRHQKPFACELLDTDGRLREECRINEVDRKQNELSRQINELLVEEHQRAGKTHDQIREHAAAESKIASRSLRIRQGFAGWLVTCPQFRLEIAALEKMWCDTMRPTGQLPILTDLANGSALQALWGREKRPTSSARRGERTVAARELAAKADVFLQRWGLERLCTWDLPVPVAPALVTFNQLGTVSSNTGMSLFVPWYLLRHRSLTINDLAECNSFGTPLGHLDEWFGGMDKQWGIDRYAKLLELYVYRNLALLRRHPSRLAKKSELLDQAFSAYWSETTEAPDDGLRGVDSVRKLRLRMDRRLRECTTAVENTLANMTRARMKTDREGHQPIN